MVGLRKVLALQFMMLLCASSASAERVMRPKFADVKLWSDDVHISHTITHDPADPHLNFTLKVLQDLHNIDVHVESRITQKEDPNYFFITNSTVNICRILNWHAQSPVGNLMHAYMKEYGKIIENCPITKGKYFVHKIWMPEDPATAMIPEVDFELVFMAYHVDENKQRTLIINDRIVGEGVVQDVANLKRGILSMLPRAG